MEMLYAHCNYSEFQEVKVSLIGQDEDYIWNLI